jgi:YrbI family 3-deoxy-D-manno-octulosonate 8-phosphate phosphatase
MTNGKPNCVSYDFRPHEVGKMTAPVRAVAVIPARGGSKGVPRKNLQKVGEATLVTRAVHAALRADCFTDVIISTDDDEIAGEAKAAGALVISRPAELSSDRASSESAVAHALDVIGAPDDVVVAMVQCSSPFVEARKLADAVGAVAADADSSAFSAAETHAFRWRLSGETVVADGHDAAFRPRRQDLPQQWIETGAFYVTWARLFRAGRRFAQRVLPITTDARFSIEIDTFDDLLVARALAPSWATSVLPKPDLAGISMVVSDFDGVMTPDTVHVFEDGTEAVTCSRADGLGVGMLRRAGIRVAIASSERNDVVARRAAKLGCDLIRSTGSKLRHVDSYLADQGLDWANVLFIGNDRNDLGCLQRAKVSAVPNDAHPAAISVADVVLRSRSGTGCLREIAELLLPAPDNEELLTT